MLLSGNALRGSFATSSPSRPDRGRPLLAACTVLADSASPRLLRVLQRVRGRQVESVWQVSTQEELNLHRGTGQLFALDAGGSPKHSVTLLRELPASDACAYLFLPASEASALESLTAAVANLASGLERESTRGIALDPLVRTALGPVQTLLGGEPFVFREAESALLEVDGLLGTQDGCWVLLNSAKLTAGSEDVLDAVGDAAKLHALLRGALDVCPAALEPFSGARVHAFLSAAHFKPGVEALAIAHGVTPLRCSGAAFHVPPHAAASLPAS